MTQPFSRRDLGLLLPALAATAARAEGTAPAALGTAVYHDKQIAYKGNDEKKSREFFNGTTHTGYHIAMHESVLGAGLQTHAPHKHEHVEIVIVMEGTLEMTNEGKSEVAEAGSVIYFASNQLHNARNVGTAPCRYIAMELRASA